MKTRQPDNKKTRSDLLKLDKESILDLHFVAVEAGDAHLSHSEMKQHLELKKQRGKGLYADMLFVLANQNFPFREAERLWFRIIDHKKELSQALSRNPGIVVATLDFITNIDTSNHDIALIQEGKMTRVTEIALKDGMTGLYDHASFQDKLHEELARFHRHQTDVSLIMADVDLFKQYNDTYGHKQGDMVLKKISSCIREEIREVDIGARYGGEEFAIIVCNSKAEETYLLAERIRERIKKEFADTSRITMSFGIADARQVNGIHANLIKAADSALYTAKERGRDRTVIYHPEMKLK